MRQRGICFVELRLHRGALQHRENFPFPDFVADVEVELDDLSRDFRRDLRLTVGDEIAGRREQRRIGDVDGRLHHDRIDERRAPREDPPGVERNTGGDQRREKNRPAENAADGKRALLPLGLALDAQGRQIGTRASLRNDHGRVAMIPD